MATGGRGAKGRRNVSNRHQAGPGANGDIRKALEIIKNSVPKDTVVLCPYIGHIFPCPGK